MKLDMQSIYAKARRTTTASIESAEPMGNVVRVVIAFNKAPTGTDIDKAVTANFNGLTPIDGSFRVRNHNGSHTIVAGFITHKDSVLPLTAKDNLKAVAANVYMDDSDNSIWQVVGGSLVRTKTEEIAELVAVANIQPLTKGHPIEALANVKDYVGATNTQIVAYVSPELAQVVAGIRVSDTHVYSSLEGLTEIAEDQVVDTENLQGSDIEDEELAKRCCASAGASEEDMVDYYSQLYAHNPLYLEQVTEQIHARALR